MNAMNGDIDLEQSYVKITQNNCKVFVDKSVLSDGQYRQIMCSRVVVPLPTRHVPDIRIQLNANSIDRNHSNNRLKASKTSMAHNSRHVLNRMNDTNGTNGALNGVYNKTIKRKSMIKNKVMCSSNKKLKYSFDSINGNNINVNTSSDEIKNKENKSNCNSELKVIGLPNMGNTCYINSIIQVLRITPGFTPFICFLNKSIKLNKSADKLKQSDKQLIESLHEVFVQLGDNEVNRDNTTGAPNNEQKIEAFIECENIKDRFEFGQQHDCHEFLNWLINELNTYAEILFPDKVNREVSHWITLSKSGAKRRNSFNGWNRTISFQHFFGVMLRNIMCSECQESSSTDDSFADIQIPLCETNEDSIADILSFTDIIHRKDYLKDENKFDCSVCSKKTNASVINSIKVPPKVLIIFIKKPFEYNTKNTRNSKPTKRLFSVPIDLEYRSDKNAIPVNYALYGFVMHSGATINNGHYYSVIDSSLENRTINTRKTVCNCRTNVLTNKGWLKVNDHRVNQLSSTHVNKLLEDENVSSTPYLAFYHRID